MKYPVIRKNGCLSSSLVALTTAALSAGLLHTSSVFAQADGSAYEEVVVTALKRDEKLLEIPLSLTSSRLLPDFSSLSTQSEEPTEVTES